MKLEPKMSVISQEAEENRFIFVVSWRSEKQMSDFGTGVWRGFVRHIRSDGTMETSVWFQGLDEIGAIVKQLLPAYALTNYSQPNQQLNPED
jgi:hypothetical protein